MEIVKAVINLKEGTLQLEGPREFVEKYLNQYDSIIKNWEKLYPLTPEKKKIEVEKVTPKRTKPRAAKPKGISSCMGRIRNLIDENYFKDPKTGTEVKDWLEEQKGVTYMSGPISGALNKLVQSGKLRRFRESKKEPYKYCNP